MLSKVARRFISVLVIDFSEEEGKNDKATAGGVLGRWSILEPWESTLEDEVLQCLLEHLGPRRPSQASQLLDSLNNFEFMTMCTQQAGVSESLTRQKGELKSFLTQTR
jgi:hypothetical protein